MDARQDTASCDLLILCASPHAGGTCARLAALAAEGARESGLVCRVLEFWRLNFQGCTHCGACERPPHHCVLAGTDDVEAVFAAMLHSPGLLWISPVYFYGLPAQAKALVDRGQRLFSAGLSDAARRETLAGTTTAVFAAAQTRGERLFDGSRLAVTYFSALMDHPLETCHGLYGVETAADITPELEAALRALGRGSETHLQQYCRHRTRHVC